MTQRAEKDDLIWLERQGENTSINSQEMVKDGGLFCVHHVGTLTKRERKSVCVCVFGGLTYLMHDHEGAGWRGEVQRQPVCGLQRRRTGLSSETLPFHRTSFPPPTASESPLRLNLSEPHWQGGTRGEGERESVDYHQRSSRDYVTRSNRQQDGYNESQLHRLVDKPSVSERTPCPQFNI